MMKNNPNSRNSLSRLLVVEPEFAQLRPVLDTLREEDYRVTVCACRDAALTHVKGLDFGVVIINLRPSCAEDAQWLQQAAQLNSHVHVILHTEQPTLDDLKAALNLGAFGWVQRGDLDGLVTQVHRAFRNLYRVSAHLAIVDEPIPATAKRQWR